MIQPKNKSDNDKKLHDIGCLGKITSFKDTSDGRFLIELSGLSNNENNIVRVLEYKLNKMKTIGYFNGVELVKNQALKNWVILIGMIIVKNFHLEI